MMIKYFILVLLVIPAMGYELIGDNLIEPRYYEGNTLIFNKGDISYSIFSNGTYLGTIEPDQGMYVNESHSYQLYSTYSELSTLSLEIVENKMDRYWYIGIILIILLIFGIKLYKVIIR